MAEVPPLSKNSEKFIKSLYRRKRRYESGLCVCEGLRCCTEVYDRSKDLIQFAVFDESFDNKKFPDLNSFRVKGHVFQKICSTVNSQGVLFVVKIPDFLDIQSSPTRKFYLLFDQIADPGNFGTVIRTAASVGLNEIWYSNGSVDPFSEKTIRSAIGAQFSINFFQYENISTAIEILRSKGVSNLFVTQPSGGKSCFKEGRLFDNSAIIFGNEANGIECADGTIPVNIPMPGKFESLNLAQSATIILFEHVRRMGL